MLQLAKKVNRLAFVILTIHTIKRGVFNGLLRSDRAGILLAKTAINRRLSIMLMY